MVVPSYRMATLVAGVLTLAAGAAIVAIAPRVPLHRATGLFFGLRGGYLTLTVLDPGGAALVGRLAVYALIAIPFSAIWLAGRLAHDFGRRRSARKRGLVVAGLLVVLTAVEAAYALDHALYFGDSDGPGPLVQFFKLQFATYAAIALAIARELRGLADGPLRRALYTFMLGFGAEPLYWATNLLVQGSRGVPLGDAWAWAGLAAGLVLFALAVAAGLRPGRRELAPAWTLAGVAVATGVLSATPATRDAVPYGLLSLPTLNAAWTLWTVAATAYASVRYRLFSVDLQVKAFLRFGSTTFLLAIVFWAASEVLEQQLGASTLWQSLAAAAAVGLALWPLQRLTQDLVERLMPGVARTEAYRRRRREDIYLAAVERARRDGYVDDGEREALRLLGHGLGLSGRDMARLESPGGATA